MGFDVYCYIRIHTKNEEEFQRFLRDDSDVFWQFKKNDTFERYKTSYFVMAIYMPVMKEACIEVVKKYHSFLIFADWHEELNPDHGYYMVRWINDDVEVKSIEFDYTCAEERGYFNSGAKELKNLPIEISYDKQIKSSICKQLNLPLTHIGYYSQVWLDTNEDIERIVKNLPPQCIRSRFYHMGRSQAILWSPAPLVKMFGDTLNSIVCEWWSEDGNKGGVWVKQNVHEPIWQQVASVNESFEFEYPTPYTPSYGKNMTPIIPIQEKKSDGSKCLIRDE